MDFSKDKNSNTCFSYQCGLCSNCVGGKSRYYYPGYTDNIDISPKETNWEKYQKMIKVSRQSLFKREIKLIL